MARRALVTDFLSHYLLGQTLSHKDARVVLVLEAKLIRIIIIKLVLFYDYHSTVHFIENRLTEIIFYFFAPETLGMNGNIQTFVR